MSDYFEKKPSFFGINLLTSSTLISASIFEIMLSNLSGFRLSIPITLMFLIYWNVATPTNIGLISIIFSALILDLYLNHYLGSNVIIFLITSYLTQRYFHRFRALFRIQQSLIVALMVLLYQLIIISIFNSFSVSIILELLLLTFLCAILWPIIYGLLRYMRIKLTYGS